MAAALLNTVKVSHDILKERSYLIDAVIVKTMKTRRTVSHVELITVGYILDPVFDLYNFNF